MDEQKETSVRDGEEDKANLSHFEGKYLTFLLNEEYYGVEILKVREIIGIQEITHVPDTEPYLKGAINLRGQVIAVIDLRLKFGLEEREHTEETCIVIVNVNNVSTGMVVDKVEEVVELAGKDIEPPPQFGASLNTDFIRGMGKLGERIYILLEANQVLKTETGESRESNGDF